MPDVNILIYAHRADEALHAPHRQWLADLADGRSPFSKPTPLPIALATIDALVDHPQARLLHPSTQHWDLVRSLCRTTRACGRHVADAQHAAVAIEHGCEWVTADAGFRKFEAAGLRWAHLRF